MAAGLWGRLNLRWQVAIAILAPCAILPVFSSFYFPSKMNIEAERALKARAESLGLLASAEIGPMVALMEVADPKEIEKILAGLQISGDVPYVGVMKGDGKTVLKGLGNIPA